MVRGWRVRLISLTFLLCLKGGAAAEYSPGGLSPARWTPGELQAATALDLDGSRPKALVRARKTVAAGLLGARAVRSALRTVEQGGNALDAALTGVLTEITLTGGAYISYAGIAEVLYYDAGSKKVYSLNGGYDVPSLETEPLSISKSGILTGRAVLVPGFMAAVDAAHRRFGKRPFAALFEPAIFFAENGIPIDRTFAWKLEKNRHSILRLEGGAAFS
ncbi:MAG: gamma-glutamyltransferase family protein [Oligoflexia bacterium]|nr:gamma-glutamyltransferase family protein [Oligoflexia bacterium]